MIIAISGRMASGKTTLAKALADELGGTAASFGDHVRALAAGMGRGSDRATLQEIGQAAVEVSPERFVEDFLSGVDLTGHGPIVIEGLRHVPVRDALLEHARAIGTAIAFVHIETDEEQRTARLRARGASDGAIVAADAHASELDVRDRLRDGADVVVQRDEDTSGMVAEIGQRLRPGLGRRFISAEPQPH